jgi:hypothetical protein
MIASFSMAQAHAQTETWYVSPAIVYTDDDPDRKIQDEIGGGQIHVGRHMSDHFTLEGLFGYSNISGWPGPGGTTPDQQHLDISANLLAFYDRDAGFAPYALVGLGYLGVNLDPGGDENRPSGTAGMGFVWTFGRGVYSLRSEVRARLAWENNNNLVDWLASVGVQYNFGAAGRAIATACWISGMNARTHRQVPTWGRTGARCGTGNLTLTMTMCRISGTSVRIRLPVSRSRRAVVHSTVTTMA